MKYCLGLIFIVTLHTAFAGSESKSSTLLLRGRVPASTTIEFDEDPDKPNVRFNGSKATPKVIVSTKNNHRQITIIHP